MSTDGCRPEKGSDQGRSLKNSIGHTYRGLHMAGYSGTPLQKKLDIKNNFKVAIINEPDGFRPARK
jgi:hypothetical protein